jgi:hypothetical protein
MRSRLRYVQDADGHLVMTGEPTHCPDGHELAGNMSRGWVPCACSAEISGHNTWCCGTCTETIYDPPCLDEMKSAGHWPR